VRQPVRQPVRPSALQPVRQPVLPSVRQPVHPSESRLQRSRPSSRGRAKR
jgi:hypothetical protein